MAKLAYESILKLYGGVESLCEATVDIVGRLLSPLKARVYRVVARLEAEGLAEAIVGMPEGEAEVEYATVEHVVSALEEPGLPHSRRGGCWCGLRPPTSIRHIL